MYLILTRVAFKWVHWIARSWAGRNKIRVFKQKVEKSVTCCQGLDGSAELKAEPALSPIASRRQTCGESRSLTVPGEGAPCPGCRSHAPPRPECRSHVPTTSPWVQVTCTHHLTLGAGHMYPPHHSGCRSHAVENCILPPSAVPTWTMWKQAARKSWPMGKACFFKSRFSKC